MNQETIKEFFILFFLLVIALAVIFSVGACSHLTPVKRCKKVIEKDGSESTYSLCDSLWFWE